MERLSRLNFLVAVCIVVYCQCVCTSGTTITDKACTTDANCATVDVNAVCINKTHCACKGAFKDTGGACVAKVLNDTCSKAEDCVNVKNATCVSNKCQCSASFKVNGAACAKKGLGDPCIAATECKAVTHALCHDKNHICSCSGGFKKQGTACVANVLGAACSSSNKSTVCTVSNTDCISGHCACLNNSFVDENDECKTAVGKTCTNPTDCPSEANCDKTCECKKGYVAENGLCHYAVGTTCSKASDCVKNANCDKATNKCTCSTGYVDSNGKCSEPKSSADSVKKTITAIVVSFLCAALLNIV